MSCFKAFFCCDTSIQLLNIDTTCEVVKISLRSRDQPSPRASSATISHTTHRSSSQRTTNVSSIKPRIAPHPNTGRNIRISPVECNKGDCEDSAIVLNDSDFIIRNDPPAEEEKSLPPPPSKYIPPKRKIPQKSAIKVRGVSTARSAKTEIERKLEENLSEAQKHLQNIRQAIIARNKSHVENARVAVRGKPRKNSPPKKTVAPALKSTHAESKKPAALPKEPEEAPSSILTPSENSSFSFTPSVVKPELAEKYRFEAELTTKLALATKQIKESPKGDCIFSISDSGKSTASPSSARGTPTKRTEPAVNGSNEIAAASCNRNFNI